MSLNGVRDFLEIETTNINKQNDNGETTLILASWKNNIEIVKLLLEVKTINVNLQDFDGDSALMCASWNGHIEVVKLLLNIETINVNLQNNCRDTALILASWNGHIEVVKLLLNIETININLQNCIGSTALIYTSLKDNIEIVELLLAKGATNAVNSNYSNDINEVLSNWKTYLPKWNRFKTYRYYPKEFNDIAMLWLLICKRKNFISKDIKLLMIEYLAESWKLN